MMAPPRRQILTTSSTASNGAIRTQVDGSIGWLVIDNEAKRNALTLAMWKAIPAAIARLCADDAVRVIVVRGAGERTFVAGADISEFEETRSSADLARAYDAINVEAFRAIKNAPKPTIARIRGHCLGGGLGIALACDLRIASDNSVFGIPAARLGIAYPLDAMSDIVEAVGPMTAKRMLYTAERIDASTALKVGIIGEQATDETLDTRLSDLCGTIAENAPLTQQAAKLGILALVGGGQTDALTEAKKAANACFDSADFIEGRDAFLQKRQPVFSGK